MKLQHILAVWMNLNSSTFLKAHFQVTDKSLKISDGLWTGDEM